MKLKQMIITALQILNIAKGTFSLEHQNQGTELEKIKDSENKSVINLLSNKTQSHNIRHSEHRNKRNAHQPPRPLDEMSANDPRHPYSAYSSKKPLHYSVYSPKKPLHYLSNFRKSQRVHNEIKNLIEQRRANFYYLKERNIAESAIGMDNMQTNLQDAQEIYKEFCRLKDKLLANQSFMRKQRKAIKASLKKKTVRNRNKPLKEYLERYNTEIKESKLDKLRINTLIADCKKLIHELQVSIKSKRLMNTPLVNSRNKTERVVKPIPAVRFNKFDIVEQQYLEKEEKFMEISKRYIAEKPTEINLLKSFLEQFIVLCKEVRLERDDLKDYMGKRRLLMKALRDSWKKHKIGNIRQAKKYYNEYVYELDDLIDEKEKVNKLLGICKEWKRFLEKKINDQSPSSVKPLQTESPTLSSQESTKSKGTHLGSTSTPTINTSETTNAPTPTINTSETTNAPTPTINTSETTNAPKTINTPKTTNAPETINMPKTTNAPIITNTLKATINTSTTASPTFSPQEVSMRIKFENLSKKFNETTQSINYVRGQISQLHSQLCLNKNLSPSDINQMEKDIDTFKNGILPKLECERREIQCAIIDEKNCIELHVEKGDLSLSLATEYIDEYNKLINTFEKPFQYSDNRRNKRDLSVKPSFLEKLASIATNNKEKLEETSVIEHKSTNNLIIG